MSDLAKKGYTIIEVLVAIAIFSVIVSLASMALNQGLKQYHGILDKGIGFWDNARYLWINKSFNSAVNYYVHSHKDSWFPYFQGTQELISYISLSPLVGDKPVVVWIRKERDNDGSRSLVYYELPVYVKSIEDIERDYVFGGFKKGNSITFLKNIKNINITYYGYDVREKQYSWSKNFDGRGKKVLPEIIRIDYRMIDEEEKKMIIVSINTNSLVKLNYDERYGFK